MRRFLCLCICVCLMMGLTVTSYGDEAEDYQANEWICENCGETATGNFCSNCGAARPEIEDEPKEYVDPIEISISGGYFSQKPDKEYLKDGYESVEIKDGYWKVASTDKDSDEEDEKGEIDIVEVSGISGVYVYSDFQKAIDQSEYGDTFRLIHNVKLTEPLVFNKDIELTLDLNGFTITMDKGEDGNGCLRLEQGVIIIKDGSAAGSGIIDSKATKKPAILIAVGEAQTVFLAVKGGVFMTAEGINCIGLADEEAEEEKAAEEETEPAEEETEPETEEETEPEVEETEKEETETEPESEEETEPAADTEADEEEPEEELSPDDIEAPAQE